MRRKIKRILLTAMGVFLSLLTVRVVPAAAEEEPEVVVIELAQTKEQESNESEAAQLLAKLAAGYDDVLEDLGGRERELQTRALYQTVLNRVDSGSYPDTVKEVVTQRKQFDRYDEWNSPSDEQLRWARETVDGWRDEKAGKENIYRVLPAGYVYIKISDGGLHFSEIFRFEPADCWSWSIPLPSDGALSDAFSG